MGGVGRGRGGGVVGREHAGVRGGEGGSMVGMRGCGEKTAEVGKGGEVAEGGVGEGCWADTKE